MFEDYIKVPEKYICLFHKKEKQLTSLRTNRPTLSHKIVLNVILFHVIRMIILK